MVDSCWFHFRLKLCMTGSGGGGGEVGWRVYSGFSVG